MTAYVAISLLEADYLPYDTRLESAARCVEKSLYEVNDSYSLAIIAYMFAKMKKTDEYSLVMKKLNKMVVDQGIFLVIIIF